MMKSSTINKTKSVFSLRAVLKRIANNEISTYILIFISAVVPRIFKLGMIFTTDANAWMNFTQKFMKTYSLTQESLKAF